MEEFLDQFKNIDRNDLTYEQLGDLLRSSRVFELDLSEYLPEEPEPGNYSRNRILAEPLEITIVRWPEEGESAIHYHEGFWGYVAVCDGIIENAVYEWKDRILFKSSGDLYSRGALIPEPDGVIHKICSLKYEPAITIHFYFPPLDSFKGMRIYDLEAGRIGVLGESAAAASWKQSESSFDTIEENAFETEKELRPAFGFSMVHLYPKPDSQEIQNLTSMYFSEIAEHYDQFDQEQKARSTYIKAVNKSVSSKIVRNEKGDTKVLSIGCGTGRRDLEIQNNTTVLYKIYGVDLSQKMCAEARRRGIEATNGAWMEIDFPEKEFDAIYFLYGFGHLSHYEHRLEFLKKVKKTLKRGGRFIFDVFNQEDRFEWGPRAIRNYELNGLDRFGYDKGDVFYKRNDLNIPAFLHYFSEDALKDLLSDAGFDSVEIEFIGYRHNPGQLVEKDEGIMLVMASA